MLYKYMYNYKFTIQTSILVADKNVRKTFDSELVCK